MQTQKYRASTARAKPARKTPAAPAEAQGDTRERLTAAAKRLFAQKGYDGTSVKEIADAAGVNVSLISYHFGGKEALYRSCLEPFGKQRLAVAQRVLQEPQSIEEMRVRLKMFVEEVIGCHLEQNDVTKILHRECEVGMPIAMDVFQSTFLKVFETLVRFFQTAQAREILRSDLEPRTSAVLFFGSVLHLAKSDPIAERFFGVTLKDPEYRSKAIEQIVSQCLHGCVRSPS